MGILFTITMVFLFTITMGFLFTIVLGIQFTISKRPYYAELCISRNSGLLQCHSILLCNFS